MKINENINKKQKEFKETYKTAVKVFKNKNVLRYSFVF